MNPLVWVDGSKIMVLGGCDYEINDGEVRNWTKEELGKVLKKESKKKSKEGGDEQEKGDDKTRFKERNDNDRIVQTCFDNLIEFDSDTKLVKISNTYPIEEIG